MLLNDPKLGTLGSLRIAVTNLFVVRPKTSVTAKVIKYSACLFFTGSREFNKSRTLNSKFISPLIFSGSPKAYFVSNSSFSSSERFAKSIFNIVVSSLVTLKTACFIFLPAYTDTFEIFLNLPASMGFNL